MLWQAYGIRILGGIVLLFLVSMYMSCQEMKYMVRGKTVEARMMGTHVEQETEHVQGYRDRQYAKRVVAYGFQDGSTFRREFADVPVDWAGQDQQTVKVQYLPGEERGSRLMGQRNTLWVVIFFGCVASMVGWVVWAVRSQGTLSG